MHTLKSETFSGPGTLRLSTGARLPINTGDPIPAAYLEALEGEVLPDGVILEEIEDSELDEDGPDRNMMAPDLDEDDEPDEDDTEFEED